MAEFPAFPLWTDAYLADTKHLTTLEHGAYVLLLIAMWRSGGQLPNDDRKLARFAGLQSNQWSRVKETIMDFMRVSSDGLSITQGRLADELAYVREHSKRQAKNARSRWSKNTAPPAAVDQHPSDPLNRVTANPLNNNASTDATASLWQCQSDAPTPTPTLREDTNVSSLSEPGVSDRTSGRKGKRKANTYTPEFEALWAAYPSTEGQSKLNAFKAWQNLTGEEKAQALASLPAYATLLKREEGRKVKHVQGYLNSRMFETMGGAAVTELETSALWQKRLGHARAWREWFSTKWGPAPGAAGCRVPAELIQAGDGNGWQERSAA